MRQYEAAGIGIIMGCLYGLVLWASIDALSLASFILYKDTRLLPGVTTALIIILGFICLFTYPIWEPVMERMIVYSATRKQDDDDDEDDDE
jgi:hypothetical protein